MKYKGSLTADSKVRRDLDRAGGYGIRLVALARPQRGNPFIKPSTVSTSRPDCADGDQLDDYQASGLESLFCREWATRQRSTSSSQMPGA